MTPQTSSHHGDFIRRLQGWGLSLALHLTAMGATISLMTGLQASPPLEPFQWNVSLVQPSPEPEQQAGKPDAPNEMERQAEAPAPVRPTVEKQEMASLEGREAPPIESPAPVSAPLPVVESRPRPAPLPPESSPVLERKPVEETPAVVTAHKSTPSTNLQTSAKPPLPSSVKAERPMPAQEAPPQPSRLETSSIQQAPASSAPTSPAPSAQKRDYGWLAEALWGRIEQLKQYPVAARLNRWEGKVILRAVIKDDGNLADLKVAQSSGYEVLDQDALDILRQTAPIKLTQPLGRPQIVIHIPISYQLK